MNTRRLLLLATLLLLLPGWVIPRSVAATFTVSPAVITNDYVGKITLTITGLTTGQTVTVERFADLNGNGTVDAGEPLFRSTTVTDGQVPLIGGVRNSNVPGDEDGATNGQVRVEFNYPGLDQTLDSIAGKYLFRVAGVVQPFAIRQKVLPQGVSGKLISAATGLPLPNTVLLLVNFNGPGVGGTVTDASGNYTNYIAPGSYTLLASGPGFVSDLAAGSVTVVTNVILSKNLTNVVADRTITGKVSDSVSTAGIPGVFLHAESTNNLITLAFSDSAGNYTMPAVASQWKVKPEGSGGADQGYVRLGNSQTVITAAGSVANVNFQFSKANALIYGTIRDAQNSNPVAAVGLYGNDNANTYDTGGISDVNGNYSVGLLAGAVNVGLDSSSLALLGYSSARSVNVTLANGQAYATNFTLQRITAHLRGQIKDDFGAPITNMTIVVLSVPIQAGGAGSIYPITDGNGNFDAGVRAGTWNIALECQETSVRNLLNITDYNYTVADGVDQNNLQLTFIHATRQITGTVKDNSNNPIFGVQLDVSANIGGTNYLAGCATTDASGAYLAKVINGTWMVQVRTSDLNARGFNGVTPQNVNISGTDATVSFTAQPFSPPTAPTLGSPSRPSASQFQFQLNGLAGQSYTVQYSTNLAGTNWLTLSTTIAPSSSFVITDPNATNKFRFYRAVSP